jgi:hypothetical protein
LIPQLEYVVIACDRTLETEDDSCWFVERDGIPLSPLAGGLGGLPIRPTIKIGDLLSKGA